MKGPFLTKCLDLLKRDDVKTEIKELFTPTINELLKHIYPYVYLSLLFVIVSFLLHLGIFILIWQNNKKIKLK